MGRWNRVFIVISVVVAVAVLLTGMVSGAIPKKINYQGKLIATGTGVLLAGTHNVTFRIYGAPDGGTALWTESKQVLADSSGVISTILGSASPITISFETPCWLEVEVDGEILLPRREIVSVAYAFRAMNADSVPGLAAPGTINASGNPVDWTKLKGVPAGFADGVDNVGGAGDGYSLDAADGSPTDVVYVDSNGRVGVGKTTPGEALDVAGSINLTGALKIGGVSALRTDSLNTFVGRYAGQLNAGSLNTFVGGDAGSSISTATDNTFLGAYAGRATTSGSGNTFVGASTGVSHDAGSNNTFVGDGAGWSNRGGSNGTFIGVGSGTSNESGQYNVFIGGGAGAGNKSGSSNTCVGTSAGSGASIGSRNTLLGFSAGANCSGSSNVFVGDEAGYYETGSNKLYVANGRNTSNVLIFGDFGARRLGVGTVNPTEALDVAGSINLAGKLKFSGAVVLAAESYNTLVGEDAGVSNAADFNTFVGNSAGRSNTTGGNNVFVGTNAGNSNEGGSSNAFVGTSAGSANISGGANSFFGQAAGLSNESGESNTSVGCYAGRSNAAGNLNVFVGASAGDENKTGHKNTFLGANAGRNNTAGSGNVFVGHEAGFNETGSNKLIVANGYDPSNVLIYGDFAAHRLGVGTTNPQFSLDVAGTQSRIDGGLIVGPVDVGVPGIHIYQPASGCHQPVLRMTNACPTSSQSRIEFAGPSGVTWDIQADIGVNLGQTFSIRDDVANQYRFLIDPSGNIGIGTISPERRLHIVGNGPRILLESTGGNPEVNFENTDDDVAQRWAIYKQSINDDLRLYQNGDRVTFQSGTGNVAIGTTDPAGYRLYVNGTAYATGGWQPSDLRLKTDLAGIDDALGKVLQLRGVSFRWRTEDHPDRGLPTGRHYGLVAQEVEQVLPEIVGSGPGDEKSLAYSELVPVLVEAVKQLKAENEALEQRVKALERARQ
jgi:hypothetical protein